MKKQPLKNAFKMPVRTAGCFIIFFMFWLMPGGLVQASSVSAASDNSGTGTDTLIQNMEQAQFFQELENVQNINAISSAETADYRLQYEEACSGQVEDTLRQKGYAVAYSKVTLNEVYEIEHITIGMEKSGDNIEKNSSVHVSDIEIPAIEIKETEEKKEHTSQEYAELEKFVCENYLVDKTQIQIEEVRR